MKKILSLVAAIVAIAACAGALAFISERKAEKKPAERNHAHKPYGLYEQYIKRPLDCFLSVGALIALSPVLLLLTVVGAVEMRGNPFFTQDRPGKDEKIFKLIKFRTMNNKKDKDGNLLPDDDRLTAYGRFLRSTSLDELPELFNIVKGDMAVVGPRPLLTQYLPYYTKEERQRHDVRPGLTGLAQVNGRNTITWDEKFRFDVKYANSISFIGDCSIIFSTVSKVFKRADILVGKEFTVGKLLDERKNWKLTPEGAIPDNEDKNTV